MIMLKLNTIRLIALDCMFIVSAGHLHVGMTLATVLAKQLSRVFAVLIIDYYYIHTTNSFDHHWCGTV